MTMLTLPPLRKAGPSSSGTGPEIHRRRKTRLLVFTGDDLFWQKLLNTASIGEHKLVRKTEARAIDRAVRLFKPAAVLLDLDLSEGWNAADALVMDTNAPPLLLFTSRSAEIDFETAIEAGLLIDKRTDPHTVLALADGVFDLEPAQQDRKAAQRLVIRWLKPCGWPMPLYRFWGING